MKKEDIIKTVKILNTGEEIPNEFYIFVRDTGGILGQINYNNYKISKSIISGGFKNLLIHSDKIKDFINGDIDYAPFVLNKTTFSSPTSHLLDVVNRYNVEYTLECLRPKTYPSRFSCIYAFGNYESCKKASYLHGWKLENLKKFRIVNMDETLNKCIKIVKCNMDIVTTMWNNNISGFPEKDIEMVINAYWNGIGKICVGQMNLANGLYTYKDSDEIYEYLIEGILEEIDEQN